MVHFRNWRRAWEYNISMSIIAGEAENRASKEVNIQLK